MSTKNRVKRNFLTYKTRKERMVGMGGTKKMRKPQDSKMEFDLALEQLFLAQGKMHLWLSMVQTQI